METLPALADPQVDQLLALAVQSNASVDTLERILAIRRELKAEHAEEQYNKAMAAFQGECPIIKKNKYVPAREGKIGYYYATMDSIVSQVKPVLAKHGLSYTFDTETEDEFVFVVCIPQHIDGHTGRPARRRLPVAPGTAMQNETQRYVGAMTYAKRHAFCDAFGIATGDEDVDGRVVAVEPITPETLDTLEDAMLGFAEVLEPAILKSCHVATLAELTEAQGLKSIERVNRYLARQRLQQE